MKGDILSFRGEHRWLSNFWPCEITYEGITYPSVENAYQAAKSLEGRESFVDMTPAQAKREGKNRDVRSDWELIKLRVMSELVGQKMSKSPFREMLLATEDAHIEEGNTWGDKYWGTCDGEGLNVLGNIIMKIRKNLKESPISSS